MNDFLPPIIIHVTQLNASQFINKKIDVSEGDQINTYTITAHQLQYITVKDSLGRMRKLDLSNHRLMEEGCPRLHDSEAYVNSILQTLLQELGLTGPLQRVRSEKPGPDISVDYNSRIYRTYELIDPTSQTPEARRRYRWVVVELTAHLRSMGVWYVGRGTDGVVYWDFKG